MQYVEAVEEKEKVREREREREREIKKREERKRDRKKRREELQMILFATFLPWPKSSQGSGPNFLPSKFKKLSADSFFLSCANIHAGAFLFSNLYNAGLFKCSPHCNFFA